MSLSTHEVSLAPSHTPSLACCLWLLSQCRGRVEQWGQNRKLTQPNTFTLWLLPGKVCPLPAQLVGKGHWELVTPDGCWGWGGRAASRDVPPLGPLSKRSQNQTLCSCRGAVRMCSCRRTLGPTNLKCVTASSEGGSLRSVGSDGPGGKDRVGIHVIRAIKSQERTLSRAACSASLGAPPGTHWHRTWPSVAAHPIAE